MKKEKKNFKEKVKESNRRLTRSEAVDHSQMLGDVQEIYGYDYKAQSSNTANKRNNAK